ncbi:hypothetical protein phytr_4920 [Candidatus Phycorickettsia trachydisci]|uniref:Uncharacterized protein n=1 Tax=Candidatus Phycorickettsia trachydisci TaxID=2115978 RepID=A0A2P1P838_9RICK|nr:hypothetical protein [Candidatus Phycorickettsia trachydisci]AVP87439.1 hypothetical protein phytr_4920 [Candidatus Phycorickettsia trachydisci]
MADEKERILEELESIVQNMEKDGRWGSIMSRDILEQYKELSKLDKDGTLLREAKDVIRDIVAREVEKSLYGTKLPLDYWTSSPVAEEYQDQSSLIEKFHKLIMEAQRKTAEPAATKIQSVFRGRQARKLAPQKRNEKEGEGIAKKVERNNERPVITKTKNFAETVRSAVKSIPEKGRGG